MLCTFAKVSPTGIVEYFKKSKFSESLLNKYQPHVGGHVSSTFVVGMSQCTDLEHCSWIKTFGLTFLFQM